MIITDLDIYRQLDLLPLGAIKKGSEEPFLT
jgi:hypothetical protein